ncbi:hypothetical protein G7B13_29905, partial [Klebsiella pneumoniae]|nr:hypothetical protein [Klebsiella pneumoniae]
RKRLWSVRRPWRWHEGVTPSPQGVTAIHAGNMALAEKAIVVSAPTMALA